MRGDRLGLALSKSWMSLYVDQNSNLALNILRTCVQRMFKVCTCAQYAQKRMYDILSLELVVEKSD